ncbi:MAG TPA: cytochrome c1 [Alphaproteobacteria bacterium]|nr:cytochrome c1 [Alphaproteobacteria bacterium]
MMRKTMFKKAVFAVAAAISLGLTVSARAQDEPHFSKQDWSFYGVFGTFDRPSLQRGFQVYKDVCSACHSLRLLSYRDLGGGGAIDGGIGLSTDEVKAIAASVQVTDGPNDQGDMFQRPGRPSDRFVSPFPNEQAARASNNGALPPDLSLIVEARPGGPDYVYGILTGFKDAPAGFTVNQGMYYNETFAGHQIAMPPPLSDGAVTYADKTQATVPQMAHDVVTFLTWAANPELESRHRIGVKVIIFLVILTGLLYAVKRKVWSDVH